MTTPPPLPTPVAAIELEYVRQPGPSWWPVVRVASTAVVVQGASMAVSAGWTVSQFVSRAWPFGRSARGLPDTLWLAAEAARGSVGIALAVGGALVLRRLRVGTRLVLALELATAALVVSGATLSVWRTYTYLAPARAAGLGWGELVGGQLLYVPLQLVLPGLIWTLFRRPELATVLDG